MPTWKAGDLTSNGVRLHYQRSHADRPQLVFGHGLTDHGRCWLPVAEQLAGDYDIVLYDARGHGRSEAPEHGYTYDNLAEDMAGLIAGLGLDRPVVIGHSMGAATAALAAERHPALMRAIVLEDPPSPSRFSSAERAANAEQWRDQVHARQALDDAELLAAGRAQWPRWSDAELAPWVEAKRLVSPRTVDIVAEPGSPWYAEVERIECPILLITGDPAAGALVTSDFAAELAGRWRAGQVAHIPGAGHSIRREQFAPYMAALRAFLDAVASN
jgi:pimeloyl-ACP methyl ester carboxylesterase